MVANQAAASMMHNPHVVATCLCGVQWSGCVRADMCCPNTCRMRSVPQPAASMAMQAATLFLFALVVGCSCAQADRKSSQPGNIRDNVVTVAVTPQYDHSFGECTASSDCAARTGVPGCSACVHSKLFDMYTKCSWRCCACDPGYGYTSTVVWGNATVKDFTALAAHMKTPDLSKVDITLAAFVCSKCTSNSWSSGGNSPCMECECNSDTPADGSNVCGKVRSGTCNSTTGACSLQTVPSGMKCGDKGTCRDGICGEQDSAQAQGCSVLAWPCVLSMRLGTSVSTH